MVAALRQRRHKMARALFLHHSTGGVIWEGGVQPLIQSAGHSIEERAFPKDKPYGWANYPYDYWNIWVNHAGTKPYKEEPTLEMLTPSYELIILKHCFPVSSVKEEQGKPDVASPTKTLGNYRLQYAALREKMRSFPRTSFLVWTPAALVAADTNEEDARRTRQFRDWIVGEWDQPGDNIFVWDFYSLETEGEPYLKEAYAASATDDHPNEAFAKRVAPLFANRILDVLAGRGDTTSLTGERR
jgi:hypothetical protein